jgi:hypothetical protein
VASKTPYLTLAAAAVLFAVMVAVEDAAASDDDHGDTGPGHSEYGIVLRTSSAAVADPSTEPDLVRPFATGGADA